MFSTPKKNNPKPRKIVPKEPVNTTPENAINSVFENIGKQLESAGNNIKNIFKNDTKKVIINRKNTEECGNITDKFIECLQHNQGEMNSCKDVLLHFSNCIDKKN